MIKKQKRCDLSFNMSLNVTWDLAESNINVVSDSMVAISCHKYLIQFILVVSVFRVTVGLVF